MSKFCVILIFTILILISIIESNDESEKVLSRQKRKLVYPPNTVLQLTMCIISQISFIPSHRVAVNLGFNVNYALPFTLRNFYSPVFWARSLTNESSPMMTFFERFIENEEEKENQQTTKIPKMTNQSNEEEEIDDEYEEEEEEGETTTEYSKYDDRRKKRSPYQSKGDMTAGEFYYGLKETFALSGYHDECLIKSVCELARHPIHKDHDDEEDDLMHELIHLVLTPSVHQSFDEDYEKEMKESFEEAEEFGKSGGDCELKYGMNCPRSPLESISNYIHTNEI